MNSSSIIALLEDVRVLARQLNSMEKHLRPHTSLEVSEIGLLIEDRRTDLAPRHPLGGHDTFTNSFFP